MKFITINDLIKRGVIEIIENGFRIEINRSMIIKGEDRLSYASIFRLIENCRELHWQNDIVSQWNYNKIDSITKSISADFIKPILVNKKLQITYSIIDIGQRSYKLRFSLCTDPYISEAAIVDMVCVFYNAETKGSINPPKKLLELLISKKHD